MSDSDDNDLTPEQIRYFEDLLSEASEVFSAEQLRSLFLGVAAAITTNNDEPKAAWLLLCAYAYDTSEDEEKTGVLH